MRLIVYCSRHKGSLTCKRSPRCVPCQPFFGQKFILSFWKNGNGTEKEVAWTAILLCSAGRSWSPWLVKCFLPSCWAAGGQIPTARRGIHLRRTACPLYFPWHGISALGDTVKLILLDHGLMLVHVWLFFFFLSWLRPGWGRIYVYHWPCKRENMFEIFLWCWGVSDGSFAVS